MPPPVTNTLAPAMVDIYVPLLGKVKISRDFWGRMEDFLQQQWENLRQTSGLEAIAVVAGILSVWYSRQENILVYPIGLVNTTIYIYLSLQGQLYGEASVNFYYTAVSLYGWAAWNRKDAQQLHVLQIQHSTRQGWVAQWAFFLLCFLLLFTLLTQLKNRFAPGAIPWADALASSAAYTGMWLMARKKVESWYWWILTNIVSIPLYVVKGYAFTGVYYLILFFLAVNGLFEWRKKARPKPTHD